MSEQKPTDWLNEFVQRNAWGILSALIGVSLFSATLVQKVNAQDMRIEKLETAIVDITQNQKDIIVLQQQNIQTTDNIMTIKEDVKDIKNALNIQ